MDVFAKKLRSLSGLEQSDVSVLAEAARDARTIQPGADIIGEGDDPDDLHLILTGFAFRYKLTSSGRRQIFAYLLPGDFCDLHVALLEQMDHSIGTLSPCEVARIPRQKILALTNEHPRIARALWMCNLVDEAVLREWVLNIGQRPAEQRIAHLFCEIHERLAAIDLAAEGSFSLPVPQSALADTLGLSEVHVSRSLRALREAGLVSISKQVVHIPHMGKLKRHADFDPAYLHLRNRASS